MSSFKIQDAIASIKRDANKKFNETIELAINLKMTKQSKPIRGFIDLPNAHCRNIKIIVFSNDKFDVQEGDMHFTAESFASNKERLVRFHYAVTDQANMKSITKYAKLLGPKNLIPSVKDGTIGDLQSTYKAFKSHRVSYTTDKTGILHAGIAKVDMDAKEIEQNIKALVYAVKEQLDEKTTLQSVHVTTTGGKSYLLSNDLNE